MKMGNFQKENEGDVSKYNMKNYNALEHVHWSLDG